MAVDHRLTQRWNGACALSVVAAVALLATGCILGEVRPNAVNVRNTTDLELTIFYDKPEPSPSLTPEEVEEMKTLTVVEPHSNGRFSIPEGDDCAKVDVLALDRDGNVVDRLPAGTCHRDETVSWAIGDE